MKIITITCLAILTSSCSAAKENNLHFEELIGNRYLTSKQLLIFGITSDTKYQQRVDYYVITEPPGIGGPEVVTKDILEPGSEIDIHKIGPCRRCSPNDRRLVIRVLSTDRYAAHDIVLSDIGEPSLFRVGKNKVSMNPELFMER